MIFLTSGLSIPIPNATVATIHWEIKSKDKIVSKIFLYDCSHQPILLKNTPQCFKITALT